MTWYDNFTTNKLLYDDNDDSNTILMRMMTWIQSWWKWWLEYNNGEREWQRKCCSFHQFQLQAVRLSFLAFLKQGLAISAAFLHKFPFFSCLYIEHKERVQKFIWVFGVLSTLCPRCTWTSKTQIFFQHSSNHLHCQLVRPCQQHLRRTHGASWPGEHLHHLWSRQCCVHTSKEEGEQS